MGTTPSTITKIEKGQLNPSYEMVSRILDFLDSFQSPYIELVRDICTQDVVTVDADDTVAKVARLLQKYGYKQVPVTKGGLWVGTIFERTVTRRLLLTDPSSLLEKKVEDIMDEVLPIVSEQTPVDKIVPLLQHSQALLISAKGKVSGIVTNADLLKIAVKKSLTQSSRN